MKKRGSEVNPRLFSRRGLDVSVFYRAAQEVRIPPEIMDTRFFRCSPVQDAGFMTSRVPGFTPRRTRLVWLTPPGTVEHR